MKLTIDTTNRQLTTETELEKRVLDLYSKEAFEVISREWLKVGWNQKYPYSFTWLGRPIVQLPEDMIRIQEVIYRIRPDVIIETGVAHGGSLIYYASLCKVLERGRVIGVDIEIRPHNRQAVEGHELSYLITLVEGSSTAPDVVRGVHSLVKPGEVVLVILDSNHSKRHVAAELEAYCDLVTTNSYIVATDGVMRDLFDTPNGSSQWEWDHPAAAAAEFVASHPEFVLEQPEWPFNESELTENITHWPDAWLRRIRNT
jgi:cephalosporin hydroxylase